MWPGHTLVTRVRPLKVWPTHINKKNYPTWQMSIVGTVKGEVERQGKRTFQNAKYSEMTPFFLMKLKK